MSVSRGCVPKAAFPFAYQLHRVKFVDPASQKVSSIIVVPADQAMGWQDGYECYSPTDMQKLANGTNEEVIMLMVRVWVAL